MRANTAAPYASERVCCSRRPADARGMTARAVLLCTHSARHVTAGHVLGGWLLGSRRGTSSRSGPKLRLRECRDDSGRAITIRLPVQAVCVPGVPVILGVRCSFVTPSVNASVSIVPGKSPVTWMSAGVRAVRCVGLPCRSLFLRHNVRQCFRYVRTRLVAVYETPFRWMMGTLSVRR